MTSLEVQKRYRESKYIESVKDIKPDLLIYKYESPMFFIDFIEQVDKNNLRNSPYTYSKNTDDSSWSGSYDMKEAISKYRNAKFDPTKAKKSSHLILKMRQGVKFNDTGDELSVPEYLSKNRDHFIEYQNRDRRKRKIFNQPIIINLSANAQVSEYEIQRISSAIMNSLYKHQIRTPRIVLSYLTDNVDGLNPLSIFVDIPYFDFNSLARFSFTSTFRRLIFCNYELIRNLSSGYGSTQSFPHPNTLNDVISLYSFVSNTDEQIDEIIDKAIQNTFKTK